MTIKTSSTKTKSIAIQVRKFINNILAVNGVDDVVHSDGTLRKKFYNDLEKILQSDEGYRKVNSAKLLIRGEDRGKQMVLVTDVTGRSIPDFVIA